MAIVTRYFSTAAAGAADGTTWADRAALFTGGAWSTVITGFDFTSDSMVAHVGPGTYTITVALNNATFTVVAPSAASPLIFHGCDSSGNRLTPPDLNWSSDLAAWDDSDLPVLVTTTNINTFTQSSIILRLLKFTASGTTTATTGPINGVRQTDWCSVTVSSSDADATGITSSGDTRNCIVSMSGSIYRCGILLGAGQSITNTKITGVAGSSGNRHGIEFSNGAGYVISRVCISGFGGDGIGTSSIGATSFFVIRQSVIANVGGTGIKLAATASQTVAYSIDGCIITGCSAYGIDAQSAARLVLTRTRLRDNSSGNINGMLNWLVDMDVYTTDSDDATEYVNAAANDFRIKPGSAIYGNGYGVSEQPREIRAQLVLGI